jgi:hypothetical protein
MRYLKRRICGSHQLVTCVILVLVCGVVPALAQQPEEQPNEIRCAGGGTTCQTGFIPAFPSNGGSAKVKDSIRTITHYDGGDPSCKPHVYTAGMTFVDRGGTHVHIVRNEGDVEAQVVAFRHSSRPAGSD